MRGHLPSVFFVAVVVALPLAAQQPVPQQPPPNVDQRLQSLEKELAELKQQRQAEPAKADDPSTLRAFWKDGLRLETNDKNVQLQFGGRIQNDWAWFHESDGIVNTIGNSQDGTEFRRARFAFQGLLWKRLEWKAEYDFARRAGTGEVGGPGFRDVYAGVTELPVVGNARVGHFKEPFSLEELLSDTDTTFMEKGLPGVFAPSRNTGAQLQNTLAEQRVTWAVGGFRDDNGDNFGYSQDDGNYAVTARVTGLPMYEEEGAQLVHVGAAYSHRDPNGSQVRFRQRPEANLANRYVDTNVLNADDVDLLGAEVAAVFGPFCVQGEAMQAEVSLPGDDAIFWGWYAEASWFLTGEHRPYDRARGTFGRVIPIAPAFGKEGGAGAVQLAARYSQLDLDDAGIAGGKVDDITGGINWYLNPNFRVTANYIYSKVEDVGEAHIAMMRFQVVF